MIERYGILITLLVQLGSIVWWASTVNQSVQTLKQTVQENGIISSQAKDKILVLEQKVVNLDAAIDRQEKLLEKLDARISERYQLR